MDEEGLDYSQCGHDQPYNILRVSYSVQFPGEEEERLGTMFLEHNSQTLDNHNLYSKSFMFLLIEMEMIFISQ